MPVDELELAFKESSDAVHHISERGGGTYKVDFERMEFNDLAPLRCMRDEEGASNFEYFDGFAYVELEPEHQRFLSYALACERHNVTIYVLAGGMLIGYDIDMKDPGRATQTNQSTGTRRPIKVIGSTESKDDDMKPVDNTHDLAAQKHGRTDVDHFKCPITQEVFVDPVIAPDGHTYERHAIKKWIKKNPISPQTRESIVPTNGGPIKLIQNKTLLKVIKDAVLHLQGQPAMKRNAKSRTGGK